MAKQKTKRRQPTRRPVQYPKRQARAPYRRTLFNWFAVALAAGLAVAAVSALVAGRSEEPTNSTPTGGTLPNTPDYHSLLVAPSDPRHLVLGTHDGLHESRDGGRTWTPGAGLGGQDAMNLARTPNGVVWVAGHNVLARSDDGGETWRDVRPDGLPHLDVHGFATDPRSPKVLWAALAGKGLYRSRDGGRSFQLVSRDVGPNVMALAVTPDGRILAGDMERGLMVSRNGGTAWGQTLTDALMGLAVNPKEPERVLAAGAAGISLSTDGGRTWRTVQPIVPDGGGPVAWAPSRPRVAYVVGFDELLYRTADGGETWRPVT